MSDSTTSATPQTSEAVALELMHCLLAGDGKGLRKGFTKSPSRNDIVEAYDDALRLVKGLKPMHSPN